MWTWEGVSSINLLFSHTANLVESDVEPPRDALVEPRVIVHELGWDGGRALPVDLVTDPAVRCNWNGSKAETSDIEGRFRFKICSNEFS